MRYIVVTLRIFLCFICVQTAPTKLPLLLVTPVKIHKHHDKYCAHTKEEKEEELKAEEKTEEKISNIMEGDIMMDRKLDQFVKKGKEVASAANSKRDVSSNFLWDTTVLPYVIDASVGSYLKNVIAEAMEDFKEFTCIRFKIRDGESDYINFKSDNTGCWSFIGKVGGSQVINLGPGCEWTGTAIHEIMHALGFFHEHTRLDRDEYVKIKFENIDAGKENNFQKYSLGEADYHGAAYDFDSVMHYRNKAFSKNDAFTIVPVDSKIDPERMGQREGFSTTDINQINAAYDCQSPIVTTPSTITSQTGSVPTTSVTPTKITTLTQAPIATEIPTSSPASITQPIIIATNHVTLPSVHVKTSPIPPTFPIANGTNGYYLFPKPAPCAPSISKGCSQNSKYPSWPSSFSLNQCNCPKLTTPSCRCKCVRTKNKANDTVRRLCYKQALHEPNFRFGTEGEIKGLQCTPVFNTTSSVGWRRQFICHSNEAPYSLKWFTNKTYDKSFTDQCLKFSEGEKTEGYLCNHVM